MAKLQENPVLSVQDVNRRLPLVRGIVRDAMELHQDMSQRRERLRDLRERYPVRNQEDAESVYEQEVRQMEAELTADDERMGEFEAELQQLGARLSDRSHGFVDFRGQLDGTDVWFCWGPQDPELGFWHAGECSEARRRPLLQGTSSVGSSEFGQSC